MFSEKETIKLNSSELDTILTENVLDELTQKSDIEKRRDKDTIDEWVYNKGGTIMFLLDTRIFKNNSQIVDNALYLRNYLEKNGLYETDKVSAIGSYSNWWSDNLDDNYYDILKKDYKSYTMVKILPEYQKIIYKWYNKNEENPSDNKIIQWFEYFNKEVPTSVDEQYYKDLVKNGTKYNAENRETKNRFSWIWAIIDTNYFIKKIIENKNTMSGTDITQLNIITALKDEELYNFILDTSKENIVNDLTMDPQEDLTNSPLDFYSPWWNNSDIYI